MHAPPTDEEKYLYVNTNKWGFYFPSIISTSILLIGLFLFSFSHWSTLWYFVYASLLLVYLGLSFAVGLFSSPFDLQRYEFSKKRRVNGPSVDIFLPFCGEDNKIIANTIKGAMALKHYYTNAKVHVLDDADDNWLRDYSLAAGANYIRREVKDLKKAGNLRNAFKQTNNDWILILDADFVPRPDMLQEMTSLIREDVAIIQTPQFFRVEKGMDYIEKGAGFVQELFYRLIQVNRNHFNAPVCVGTCALYRREALAPFGGTAAIDYSEDLHTGFMVMCHGWEVKYYPINLAAGLCPDNLPSYFTQQYRWCMGSITLMFNPEFWRAGKIDVFQRMCFLTGMLYYIATAAGLAMTVVPSMMVLFFLPYLAHWYSIIFSLPSLVVGTIAIALWSKNRWGAYAVEARIVSYWAHLFAIIDKVRGDKMPWVATGQTQKTSRFTIFKWCFSLYTALLISLLVFGFIRNQENLEIIPMVILSGFYRVLDLHVVYRLFSRPVR